jgi:hypothetical protein
MLLFFTFEFLLNWTWWKWKKKSNEYEAPVNTV